MDFLWRSEYKKKKLDISHQIAPFKGNELLNKPLCSVPEWFVGPGITLKEINVRIMIYKKESADSKKN